jgi:hypothetical protein
MQDNFFFFAFLTYCAVVYLAYLQSGWRQSTLGVLSASIWVAHLPPSNGIVKYVYIFILILAYFATQRIEKKSLRTGLAYFAYLGTSMLWLLVFVGTGSPEFDTLYRIVLLAPMSIVVGYQAVKFGAFGAFLVKFKTQGLIFSSLALVEFLTARNWVPQRFNEFVYNNSEGRVRVFTEHPLVLAVLLTVAAFIVVTSSQESRKKFIYVSLLFLASLTTQAISAPLLIVLFFIWEKVSKKLNISLQANFKLARIAVSTTFFALLAFSSTMDPFSGLLVTPGEVASTLYRYVIYGLMWVILADYPLGLGPLGLPDGLYTIPSIYGDLNAASLDSEIVYSVSQFGYLGLIFYVLLIGSLYLIRSSTQARFMMLTLLFVSLFASIHSWVSLSIIFFMTLGGAVIGRDTRDFDRER